MNEQQRIVFDYWMKGTIDDAAFTNAYGILPDEWPAEISRLFQLATATGSADILEYATHLHARLGTQIDVVPMFNELVTQTWHNCHEYMIRYLQEHPSEASVAALGKAIALKPSLDYLDYDDYGAYYKRCMWALAVNPSPDAIEVIKECARSNDDALREQAVYRLRKLGVTFP